MTTNDHGYANSNYRPLRTRTPSAEYIIREEVAYRAKAGEYARINSTTRLKGWARRFPWIRGYVQELGVDL